MLGQSIQCDFCSKTDTIFDEQNANKFRIHLTANHGWYFMKIDRQLRDFCSDECCQKWLLKNRNAVMA